MQCSQKVSFRGAKRRGNPHSYPPFRSGERIATASVRTGFAMTYHALQTKSCHSEERSDVGIRILILRFTPGTDCHSQCAHWLRNDKSCSADKKLSFRGAERRGNPHSYPPFHSGERIATASVRTGFAMTYHGVQPKGVIPRSEATWESAFLSSVSLRGTDCHSQCAHWPRNDISCIADKKLSFRGAKRRGNPYSFHSSPHPE